MTTLLSLTITDQYHPSEKLGGALTEWLKHDASLRVVEKHDKSALSEPDFASFDILLTCLDWNAQALTEEEGDRLIRWVQNGGKFIGIHGATAVSAERTRYIDLIGARVTHHSPYHEFPVVIVNAAHPITAGMSDFRITDELYCLDRNPVGAELLATAHWKDKDYPMLYTKRVGKGVVVYNALGHDTAAYENPAFKELVLRSVAWVRTQ